MKHGHLKCVKEAKKNKNGMLIYERSSLFVPLRLKKQQHGHTDTE